MKWYIPVRWDMMSRMRVEAYTLEDAIGKAKEICNSIASAEEYVDPNYSEMIDGSFEIDIWDENAVEYIRNSYNDGNKDIDVEPYPELKEYIMYVRDIGDNIGVSNAVMYEILFEAGDATFNCKVWLTPAEANEEIALGMFFRLHPNITYGMVKYVRRL